MPTDCLIVASHSGLNMAHIAHVVIDVAVTCGAGEVGICDAHVCAVFVLCIRYRFQP